MPHRWSHTSPSADLDALLRVAARTGATLSLRGDMARAIWGCLEDPRRAILDAIPPLARFEVDVFPPGSVGELTADVLGEIRRELPWTGFFSIRLARRKTGTELKLVRLIDEPRVLILPDARALAAARAAHPRERLLAIARDEQGRLAIDMTHAAGRIGVESREHRDLRDVAAADALHDLIQLATEMESERRTLADIDDRSQVISSLSGILSKNERVHPTLSAEDPDLQLALLRYVTRRTATTDALEGNAKKVLTALSARFPATSLAQMVSILTTPEPFRAVVLPQPDGSRALKEIVTNEPLTAPPPSVGAWAGAVQDANGEGLFVSNPVAMDAPGPDPCCRYRDFSRGVAEVVWSTAPRIAEQRLPIVLLVDDGEFMLGSGYLSAPGAASLRFDYGLLGYLLGRAGRVEVAAAWKPEPPAEEPPPGTPQNETP